MNQLLLLCDDLSLARIIQKAFKQYPVAINNKNSIDEGLRALHNTNTNAVLIKLPLLNEECPKKIIKSFKTITPYLPIYFILDHINHEDIVTLVKQGAENIYVRPYNIEKIAAEINNTFIQLPPITQKEVNTPIYTQTHNYLRAQSKAAQLMYKQIDTVADTNFTVIIYGETGTGKESVARRLCQGKYHDKPFIAVDCGCLNKDLAASELFGHKKGSFTSAIEDKIGAFEKADNGTLFLDEIGNLDYNVQMLLLRAIEEKKIRKIGSNDEKDINVRIIVASNEKLINAVKQGKFREDLFYRLNEFEINIPPLRKRKDDILPFINYFINQANTDLNKNIKGVEERLLSLLLAYHWPGNIRELKNTIRRGCLMADDYITQSCMTQEFIANLNILQSNIHSPHKQSKVDPIKYKVLKTEYEHIMNILIEENFNKSTTAQRLNMNRKTLYNKLKVFDSLNKNLDNSN